jgi:hypothetical protein
MVVRGAPANLIQLLDRLGSAASQAQRIPPDLPPGLVALPSDVLGPLGCFAENKKASTRLAFLLR